jgi:magnesium-transporting ATPase (P-type)
MYLSFGTILLITGTIAMSRPSGIETQYVPDANMMGLHCHLIYWGNLLIPFSGMLGAWFYYFGTEDYSPNPKTDVRIANGGFNSKNKSTTLIFLLVILAIASNAFIMYRSMPWREKFFRNYLFTILISVNFSLALIFAFTNK